MHLLTDMTGPFIESKDLEKKQKKSGGEVVSMFVSRDEKKKSV